jgi:hypothetical protein
MLYKVKNTPGKRNPSGIGHIDYVGHIWGSSVALELKATTGERFRLSSVSELQRSELLDHWKYGALSFLMVRFWLEGKPAVLTIPYPLLESFCDKGIGSLSLPQLAEEWQGLLLPRLAASANQVRSVLWDLSWLEQIYINYNHTWSGGSYELRPKSK